jgi:DNA primase
MEGGRMARIPEHEVERLKKDISVQRLAEARGIKLTRHGADLIGKCPFHDDRTPSLVITRAKNLWHCLGACNAGGTVIDWTMRAEGIASAMRWRCFEPIIFPWPRLRSSR